MASANDAPKQNRSAASRESDAADRLEGKV